MDSQDIFNFATSTIYAMDITSIYIKNFRVFGEEGANIKLSPVTLLTGCNSAGKSSLAKAILLLQSYLSKVKERGYNFIETPMDFSNVVKLGTFDSVLNKSAKEHGAQNIVFGFSWSSTTFVGECQALFTFGKKQSDMLCNGWLSDLTFRIDNEDLFSVKIIDDKYSLDIIDKEKFIEYYHYYMVHQLAGYAHEELMEQSLQEEHPGLNYPNNRVINLPPLWDQIFELEKSFISQNKINRILWNYDWNKRIFEQLEKNDVKDVIAVTENIIRFRRWDSLLYEFEAKNHRRIECDDVNSIVDEYSELSWGETLNEIKNDAKTREFINQHKSKEEGILREKLAAYISSDYPTISAYLQSKNTTVIQEFLNAQQEYGDYESLSKESNLMQWLNNGFNPLALMEGTSHIISFLEALLNQCLNTEYTDKTAYVDASTTDVRRSYALDNPDKFAKLWKQYNDIFISDDPFGPRHSKGEFMRKWLREFDVCDDIVVENINGSLQIKLISQENPDGRMLADYGYGVTQLVALLLNIEIALCNVEHPHLTYAGLHPAASGCDSTKPVLLIIEEPEVHLHPSLQSKLADMFLDASQQGVHFIVETHSEYLIRRTQVLVSEKDYDADTIENSPFRTYYFPKNDLPYDMKYRPSGNFEEAFGSGFFDVAGKSTRELIRKRR